jgi:hypothetical protein
MKKIMFTLFSLLLLSSFAFASQTITDVKDVNGMSSFKVITISWTAAANGSVTPESISDINTHEVKGMYLSSIETNPGSPAPTELYDIVVTDVNGLDIFGANCLDRSSSITENCFPLNGSKPIDSSLTITISNNSVNSATGTIKLYFTKSIIYISSGGTSGSGSTENGGRTTTAAPTYSNGTDNPFSLTTKGGVRATLMDGAGAETGLAAAPLFIRPVSSAGVLPDDSAVNAAINSGENPVYMGGIYESSPATIDSGDKAALHFTSAQNLKMDLASSSAVISTSPWANGTLATGTSGAVTGTSTTPIIAGTASNYTYITNCLVINSHATVGTVVTLEEETSGTDLYVGYAAALGGGFVLSFPTPLKVPTVAKGINVLNGTTGANVYASCTGFKSTVSY